MSAPPAASPHAAAHPADAPTEMRVSSVRAVAGLLHREIVRFVRQPNRILGSAGTPFLIWIFFAAGIGPALRIDASGGDPFRYFLPGAILLVILFTSIFANISLIEDRREGILQSVLVAPIPRGAIVLGKVAGGALLAALQGMLLLALAAASGVRIPWAHVPAALGAVALVALALSAMGFALAWKFDSVQAFHAIMNLFLMPMWLLSGAAFPIRESHPVLRAIAAANPATYALESSRTALAGDSANAARPLAITAVFCMLCLTASAAATRARSSPPPG